MTRIMTAADMSKKINMCTRPKIQEQHGFFKDIPRYIQGRGACSNHVIQWNLHMTMYNNKGIATGEQEEGIFAHSPPHTLSLPTETPITQRRSVLTQITVVAGLTMECVYYYRTVAETATMYRWHGAYSQSVPEIAASVKTNGTNHTNNSCGYMYRNNKLLSTQPKVQWRQGFFNF